MWNCMLLMSRLPRMTHHHSYQARHRADTEIKHLELGTVERNFQTSASQVTFALIPLWLWQMNVTA